MRDGRTRKINANHLVTQYLEKVSSTALEDFSHIVNQYAGRRHGIYSLYKRDKLYYVGLAKSLKDWLYQHLRDSHAKKWESFNIYLTIDNKFMRELETLVAHIVSPKGNSQRGKLKAAEKLNGSFKRDIIADMKRRAGLYVGKPRSKSHQTKRRVEGGPILAQYGITSLKLRGVYKGNTYKALVLKNVEVKYSGKRFNSPSLAGKSARGGATNGWTFWCYLRGPGDWAPIAHLRR